MSKQLILLVVALLLSLSFALAKHRDAFDEMAELADWPFAEKKVCPDICPPTNCKHGLNTDINGCPLPTCARLEGNDKWIRNGESLLKNVKQVCFYQEVCRMHCPYGFKSYKVCCNIFNIFVMYYRVVQFVNVTNQHKFQNLLHQSRPNL